MIRAAAALAGVVLLAGCAAQNAKTSVNPMCPYAPSQSTYALLAAGVDTATIAAQDYEAQPGASATGIADAKKAVSALEVAWVNYQGAIKSCTKPSLVAVQTALDEINQVILLRPQ